MCSTSTPARAADSHSHSDSPQLSLSPSFVTKHAINSRIPTKRKRSGTTCSHSQDVNVDVRNVRSNVAPHCRATSNTSEQEGNCRKGHVDSLSENDNDSSSSNGSIRFLAAYKVNAADLDSTPSEPAAAADDDTLRTLFGDNVEFAQLMTMATPSNLLMDMDLYQISAPRNRSAHDCDGLPPIEHVVPSSSQDQKYSAEVRESLECYIDACNDESLYSIVAPVLGPSSHSLPHCNHDHNHNVEQKHGKIKKCEPDNDNSGIYSHSHLHNEEYDNFAHFLYELQSRVQYFDAAHMTFIEGRIIQRKYESCQAMYLISAKQNMRHKWVAQVMIKEDEHRKFNAHKHTIAIAQRNLAAHFQHRSNMSTSLKQSASKKSQSIFTLFEDADMAAEMAALDELEEDDADDDIAVNVNASASDINVETHIGLQGMSSEIARLQQQNKLLTHKLAKTAQYKKAAQLYKKQSQRHQQISTVLYPLYVRGEEPRFDLISLNKECPVWRDAELHQLRLQIQSLYPTGKWHICGKEKWKGKSDLESSVQQFVGVNGEYCVSPVLSIHGRLLAKHDVIEKFGIHRHDRIPALNQQCGVRAKMSIPAGTCFGQYFGGELLQSAFGVVFEETADECIHNLYAFDQQIEPEQIKQVRVKFGTMDGHVAGHAGHRHSQSHHPNHRHQSQTSKRSKNRNKSRQNESGNADEAMYQKTFVIDPFLGTWSIDDLLLRFVNDCRVNIENGDMSKDDETYYNVEFVGVSCNGWPQTYLIARREIKKGEELLTYYGQHFGDAVGYKMECMNKRDQKRRRIDAKLKRDFGVTLQLPSITE